MPNGETGFRGIVLWIFFLLWSTPVLAAPSLLLGSADSYRLGGATVEVVKDPGRGLTITDVTSPAFADKFVPVRREIPNFGMTDAAFWFRFTIDAGKRGDEKWLLLLEQPLMNLVDLYVPLTDGGFDVKRSGDHIPMSRRDIREREIVLSLPLATAPRTFYLRAWIAGRSQMPLTIMTREAFQRRKAAQNFLFGGYTGLMLVLAFAGLFLFALLRDRTYLYYACLSLGILFAGLDLNGYLYAYVIPEHPRFHEYMVLNLCVMTILAGLLFARSFLRLAEYAPRLCRPFGWLLGLNLLMLPLSLVMPLLLYKKLLNADMLISSMTALVAAIACYRGGFAPARFYAYGRIAHSVCGIVYPLANEGILPANWVTSNFLLLASVGDILFITLAMGHHVYVMQRRVVTLVTDLEQEVAERTAAHRALKEQMEEKRRLELEVRHVSREERRRISYELHDGLCQQLTGANLRFAALEDRLSEAGVMAEAQPLGTLLRDSVTHAYALSRRLWTSEGEVSKSAPDLDELARQLSARSSIPVRLDLKQDCPVCSSAGITHIRLIAREAMVNAVKHSGATLIMITLRCSVEQGIRLEVRDDGSGITGAKGTGGGLGMGMMERRAAIIGGHLEIADAQGGGTSVVCVAPCTGVFRGEAVDG